MFMDAAASARVQCPVTELTDSDEFTMQPGMRKFVCLLFTAVALAGAAARSLSAQQGESADTRVRAEQLVRQLGSDRFAQREHAMQLLLRMGLPAMTALEAGQQSDDAETRYRCALVLQVVRHQDFQRRLKLFLARDPAAEQHPLPAWNQYKALVGDSEPSRQLFVEMLQAEYEMMRAVERGTDDAAKHVNQRLAELQNWIQVHRQQPVVRLGSVAAMLLASIGDEKAVVGQARSIMASYFYQSSFSTEIRDGKTSEILRTMLGRWVAQCDEATAYQGLHLSLQFDLKEGLVSAKKILRPFIDALAENPNLLQQKQPNAWNQPYFRLYALLVVARFGDESHYPLVEPLLADTTPTGQGFRVNNTVRYHTQIRDVALACLVHLAKQDFKEFGFQRLQLQALYVFDVNSLAFENDAQRGAAIRHWHEYRAKAKSKTAGKDKR